MEPENKNKGDQLLPHNEPECSIEEGKRALFNSPNEKESSKLNENDGKENPNGIKLLLGGSAVLNVLLCIQVGKTLGNMLSNKADVRMNSGLCLNCSHVTLYPDADLRMFDVYESNICCVKEGGNYSSIVDKLVERDLKERLILESRQYEPLHCSENNRVSPVIKMVGRLINYPDQQSSNSIPRFSWLKWDIAVHRNGSDANQLSYDDRHIIVENTGIYYIYSQLVFRNTRSEEPSSYAYSSDRHYMHAIYKTNGHNIYRRILGGSYTYYPNKDGDSVITSYLGSPFQLIKGDMIGVKVHDVDEVVPSNFSNFFGMHLI